MSSFLLDPIGFRLDGRPFYGFSGAEGEADGKEDDPDDDGDEPKVETDPLKRTQATLQKVTDERRAIRDEYRPVKAVLRELGIDTPEALRAALTKTSGKQEQQVDVEKVKAEAKAEATLESNRELALAKVEVAAKGLFADPDDAVDHLRKNVDDLLGRDGKPDKTAIKRELDDLLAAKPHWGAGTKEDLSFDGGARQTGGAPKGMDAWLRDKSRGRRG
jgi:antitoxin component of RelBE/YafQ-DinJ toxin-antitoxin module